jgi:meso-butanediol dehydrogenase / (S,S)-butanediol dehydrogenase / diacetyl reductase
LDDGQHVERRTGELTLMDGLRSKRVLITGGASGIGAATVARFLAEGSRVVIFDRDEAGCERLCRELPLVEAALVVDVADAAAVRLAFDRLDRLWGGVDVLINNAGISIRHTLLDITESEWRQVIDVNLSGVFWVAQQAARRMSDARSGVILNMGSTNGIAGYPHYADYNASKAGVIELTRSMALELAPAVRVNAVCPGYVMTPMQQAEYTPQMIEAVNAKIPMRRHARPEEIAGLFAFLASDAAAYITGQVYVIDGGELAGGLASR